MPSTFSYCFAFLVACMLALHIDAQVLNMDKVSAVNDSTRKWHLAIQAATDFSSEKKVYDWDAQDDATKYCKGNHLLGIFFKNSFTSTDNNDLQNSGYLHIRFRDNDTRKLSPEYFTQYQWDNLRGMLNRYLFGCNARFCVKESKEIDCYIGLGLMYEWEKWDFNGVDSAKIPPVHPDYIRTHLLKLNQYIKISAKLFKTTEFTFTNFIQARPDKYIVSPRIADFLQWSIPVSKKFAVTLNFESIYDAAPVVPIKHFYYDYTTGFSFAL